MFVLLVRGADAADALLDLCPWQPSSDVLCCVDICCLLRLLCCDNAPASPPSTSFVLSASFETSTNCVITSYLAGISTTGTGTAKDFEVKARTLIAIPYRHGGVQATVNMR